MLSLYKALIASTLALQAAAKTVRIDVGNGALRFSPNVTQADKGDILEFHFFAVNHSVVQGRFDRPCQPAQTRPVFSGFTGPIQAGQEGPNVFQVTVNDTKPLVFYCSQNNNFHCAKGMYAVVNPGAQTLNLEAYGAGIRGNLTAVSPPGGPRGGVFSQRANVSTTASTATPAPTSTNGSGGGGGSETTLATTATPSPTDATGTGAPQTTSRPGGGAHVQASVGGLVGAVLAAALML